MAPFDRLKTRKPTKRSSSTRKTDRVRTAIAVMATGGILLSGCGSDASSSNSSTSTSTAASTYNTASTWLLAMEQGSSSSGGGRRLYVSLDTATGKTTQIPMPKGADVDTDPNDVLEVSADLKFAILANTLPDDQVKSAILTLYPLAEAQQPIPLDLRAMTKQVTFTPIAASLDPTDAAKLRVVDEEGFIWDINPSSKTATKENTRALGAVDSSTSIRFDPRSGKPYIDTPTSSSPFPGWLQPGGEVLTEGRTTPPCRRVTAGCSDGATVRRGPSASRGQRSASTRWLLDRSRGAKSLSRRLLRSQPRGSPRGLGTTSGLNESHEC